MEKQVAITVWKLVTSMEYRTRSSLFGIGTSTVSCIVSETYKAVSEQLMEKFVSGPEGDQLKKIVKDSESVWGLHTGCWSH